MDNSSYIKDTNRYAQELERYELMVDYFENNKDRINSNTVLLDSLDKTLYNHVQNGDFPRDKSTDLYNRLHPLLEDNLRGKLKAIEAQRKEKGNWLIGRVPSNKSEGNFLI